MKEILFIRASSCNIGGVEGQILKIAKNLFSRNIFSPVLVTSDKNSSFAQSFGSIGPVYKVPMGKKDIGKAAKIINGIISQRNIAVIQTHMFRESLIGRKLRKINCEIPHVLRAQTYIDCSCNPRWKKRLYHLLDRMTSRYVDYYLANGQYLADEIIKISGVRCKKVHVLLDAVEQIGQPDELNGELDMPLPMRIAMVANLLPIKGHDTLINALAILKKKGLPVKVRLIGGEATGTVDSSETSFTDNLKAKAQQLGVLEQIEFYGHTHDVYKALQGFPIVVLPSNSEGVPNCVLEALGLRKLVIVSNVGGVSEVIQNGINGLLHPARNAQAFAGCLEKVFTTPAKEWETVRNAGYETWKEKFSMDKMMDGLINVYRELGVLE